MTGYTSDMARKNMDFRQFALSCARAFGALIHMRDDNMGAEITMPEVSGYHLEQIQKIEAKIAAMNAVPTRLRATKGREMLSQSIADYTRDQAEDTSVSDAEKCRAMLAEAKRWEPPTPEHNGIKNFMVQQLEASIPEEGRKSYWQGEIEKLQATDPLDYFAETLAKLNIDLEQHKKCHAEDVARVESARKWITDLMNSLGHAAAR